MLSAALSVGVPGADTNRRGSVEQNAEHFASFGPRAELRDPPSCTRRCGDPAEGAQRDVHDAMGEAMAVPPRTATHILFLCGFGGAALLRLT